MCQYVSKSWQELSQTMDEITIPAGRRLQRHLFSTFRMRLVLLILLILIPALVLALYTASAQSALARQATEREALRLAQLTAANQEQIVNSAEQLLIALAQLSILRNGETEACNELFVALREQYDNYTNFFMVDTEGDTVCTGIPEAAPINVADRSWFARAMQTDGFSISEYGIGAVTGKPVITLSYPIHDDDGQVRFQLGTSLDLERIAQFAIATHLPARTTLNAIDRNGTVLYRYPDPEQWIGQPLLSQALVDLVHSEHSGTIETTGLDGENRLYGFAPLDSSNESAFIIIGLSNQTAFAQVKSLLLQNLFGLGAVAVVTFFLIWYGTGILGWQVNTLVASTNRLARGDLSARVDVKQLGNTRELHELGISFNEMARALELRQRALTNEIVEHQRTEKQLKQARDELESRVAERTADLAFLAEAGMVLASSLDYEITLSAVARLAVPKLGDWCVIDVLGENESTRQIAIVHAGGDSQRVEQLRSMNERYPVREDALYGYQHVIRTGEMQHIEEITPAILESVCESDEQLELLRELNLRSGLSIPLKAQERVLGAITFATAESGRVYRESEISLAEELARRAALAVDNAQLYREVRQQREHLHVTLSSIGDAVIVTDVEGRITFINTVAQSITRWQEASAVGRPLDEVFSIVSETSGQSLESPFIRVMQAGEVIGLSNNTLLIARDGTRIPIDDSGAPIRGADGEVIGIVLVFRDISERRQAETRLKAALLKTRDLYEISRRISSVNSADDVLRALMASSYLEGVRQVSILTFDRPWDDQPPTSYEALAVLHPELTFPEEAGRCSRLDHHPLAGLFSREVPTTVAAVRDQEAIGPDIRAQLEEAGIGGVILFPLLAGGEWYGMLLLYYGTYNPWDQAEVRHIQGLVDQVAVAIDNIRLFAAEAEARQQAEEANQHKLKFMGMISHELRTPLASIKGFATTLLAEDVSFDDENLRQFYAIIDEEADKLTELIEQLLDLSSLQAGTLRIIPEAQPVQAILDAAMAQLEMLASKHELVVEIPSRLPLVQADAHRIGQVLGNLVGNAAKYSPAGTRIRITAQSFDGGVRVDVADQGPGIPREARSYIFEPFRQANSGRSAHTGAGLGLAICNGLIESHNGRIWIDDACAEGTTISFVLPAVSEIINEQPRRNDFA
jgi:PAS domain S-box-containing protein